MPIKLPRPSKKIILDSNISYNKCNKQLNVSLSKKLIKPLLPKDKIPTRIKLKILDLK